MATGADGRFAPLVSDGGNAPKSWEQIILPGIANDRAAQRRSLEWIAQQAADPLCGEALANHDAGFAPHDIEL